MRFLDWMKDSVARQRNDDHGRGWQRLGVYLYRADGRYPPATWAETPQAFYEMIPAIQKHLDNKLEVRITNGDDHMLFHATGKGIEWDGIGLSERTRPAGALLRSIANAGMESTAKRQSENETRMKRGKAKTR
jgi:hypothetical protein